MGEPDNEVESDGKGLFIIRNGIGRRASARKVPMDVFERGFDR